jgi:hypothetical protein
MKQVTSKLIRIFSLIFLFAFFVDTADAQRRQRGERQTKERQGRTREKSKRSDTETVEVADEIPEFQQAVEDGSIPELKRSESKGASGRRRAGRRSARVAGAGKAEGTEALDNFLVHPKQYIAKWRESRGESRWMTGTPSDCAAECLKEENQWCDAFFAWSWGGIDRCVLTDDVDPMVAFPLIATLASYTYFDKATADRAASADEMVREIAQKDAEIEASQNTIESLEDRVADLEAGRSRLLSQLAATGGARDVDLFNEVYRSRIGAWTDVMEMNNGFRNQCLDYMVEQRETWSSRGMDIPESIDYNRWGQPCYHYWNDMYNYARDERGREGDRRLERHGSVSNSCMDLWTTVWDKNGRFRDQCIIEMFEAKDRYRAQGLEFPEWLNNSMYLQPCHHYWGDFYNYFREQRDNCRGEG